MSPSPTLRATSTSRPSSIENIASPSTSAGARPASSMAAEMAWHASDSSESASPFPKAVCPIPTIAVWSVSGPLMLAGSPASELGGPALHERGDALTRVVRAADQLHEEALLVEEGGAVDVEGAVEQPLGEPDRLRGTAGETLGPLLHRGLEVGRRNHLVDEAEACRVLGGQVVAEEHHLLRLLQPDPAREEVSGA